ncbi:unnamed protein product [Protopolystoma xenopodis]|uniref:G-protein coupled receptors family 1 profile domain-containing protein n=1 Tax=Protopolystoma xenopodis TaxID=117903 RepID=A0A448XLH6_9PLAT|nr:unnamed protein product [Protopolystoma xenopodis]
MSARLRQLSRHLTTERGRLNHRVGLEADKEEKCDKAGMEKSGYANKLEGKPRDQDAHPVNGPNDLSRRDDLPQGLQVDFEKPRRLGVSQSLQSGLDSWKGNQAICYPTHLQANNTSKSSGQVSETWTKMKATRERPVGLHSQRSIMDAQELRVTRRLLLVSIVFCLLSMPLFVNNVIRNGIGAGCERRIRVPPYSDLTGICLTIFQCNFCINFLLYCMIGKRFRRMAWRLLAFQLDEYRRLSDSQVRR